MIDTAKLTADIQDATAKAHEAIVGMKDEGTCNFDGVFLATGEGCQLPGGDPAVEAAIKAGGAITHHKDYGIRLGYVISLRVGGQGFTRTKAAEVACEHLREAGWGDVSMWYQMD